MDAKHDTTKTAEIDPPTVTPIRTQARRPADPDTEALLAGNDGFDFLMTLAEGAKLLRVSKSTIYRLVKDRTLEHYKIPGGQMLVDRRQIRQLMLASIVPAIGDRDDVAS